MSGPDTAERNGWDTDGAWSSVCPLSNTMTQSLATHVNKKFTHFASLFPGLWATCIDFISVGAQVLK